MTTDLAVASATRYAVAAVLRSAANAYRDGLITFGRHWFIADDGDGRCRCALGAITWVIDPDNLYDDNANPMFAGPLATAAAVALAEYLGDRYRCTEDDCTTLDAVETVGGWNDKRSTRVEDVIAALDAAAARLETATGGAA